MPEQGCLGTLCAVGLARVDDETGSIESFLQALPASAQAHLQWLPETVRQHLVKPLREAGPDHLHRAIDAIALDAARALFRVSRELSPLFGDPVFLAVVRERLDHGGERFEEAICTRLQTTDPWAADDLREAMSWMRAVIGAIVVAPTAGLADAVVQQPTDAQLRAELRGSGGSLIRGLFLTMAVGEMLVDPSPLPPFTGELCRHALIEMQAAANALRANGFAVSTAVHVIGYTPREWEERRGAGTTGLMPARLFPESLRRKLLESFAPVEIWLFGSRARGTHGPDSDWDLLVVLEDGDTSADDPEKLAPLRTEKADVVFVQASDFAAARRLFGTLSNVVVTEGYRVYER